MQVIEPARVKGLGPKPHILKSRVARSHCVAQTSSQSVDTGRITGWQPFLRSMIIIVWNYLSLFCVHTWPDVFSWPYLTSREVREKGKVWIWGMSGGDSLVFVVSHLCCFSFFDMGFDFYSPDVDECANPRSCPEHSTCHNSPGSYSCVCNSGFQSRSGRKSFQGLKEMCQGIWTGLLGNQGQCVWKDRSGGEKLRWV